MSDTPKSGMELLRESGPTLGEVIERLANENAALREQVVDARRSADYWKSELKAANTDNAALRDDNRKLALHTAEQAKELGKLRDQLEVADARIAELEAALQEIDSCYNPEMTAEQNFLLALMLTRAALAKEKP